MYLGNLSTVRAAQLNLWRLTTWERADSSFEGIYHRGRTRLMESQLWAVWCENEAQRIGRDPRRKAAVVERKSTIAVFVDRIAGDGQEDIDRDEGDT